MGDFDPVSLVPYQLINGSQINTPDSQALNLKMTAESIVLLKNSGTLPLKISSIKQKLAVIGPNANASTALLSNYQGIPAFITTVYEGIKSTGVPVGYAPGCPDVTCANKSSFSQALSVAADADFVIAVMGLDGTVEGEGHDRVNTTCDSQPVDNLALPGCQTALVEEIIAINPVAGNYTGSFEVNAYLLSLVDRDGEHYVFPGSYIVVVTDGAGNRLTAPFVIEGSVTNVKECPGAPSCLAC